MATKLNVLVLGVIGLVFVLCSRPLIGLFTQETEVMHFGTQALWIVCLAFPMYAAGMCFEGAFNGAGDTWTPARLNLYCLWLGQIPIAWVLSKVLGLGPLGVFIAVPASFTLLTIWSGVLFRRGKWKLKKV
jgi:Na+-driven multidrug efflux pump